MSRSIHTTWRSVRHWPISWFDDPPDETLGELVRKRRTKRRVRQHRQRSHSALPASALPAAVPVTVEEGEHVLHAARPSDVQAILEALPPDAVEGLVGVRLVLGLQVAHHLEWMRRDVRGRWFEPDALRAEAFAEALQAEWTQAYVLPHVERCRRGGLPLALSG